MGVIKLGQQFQPFAADQPELETPGDTVRQCLEYLASKYPVFQELLFDAGGTLSALVLVDGKTIVPKNIDQPVSPMQEIIVLPMVQGG
jgi:hypothetical protein